MFKYLPNYGNGTVRSDISIYVGGSLEVGYLLTGFPNTAEGTYYGNINAVVGEDLLADRFLNKFYNYYTTTTWTATTRELS